MKEAAQGFAGGAPSNKMRPALLGHPVQPELRDVAQAFVDLQEARHAADYDTARRFSRSEALSLLNQADQAFADWKTVRGSLPADAYLVALLVQRQMRA